MHRNYTANLGGFSKRLAAIKTQRPSQDALNDLDYPCILCQLQEQGVILGKVRSIAKTAWRATRLIEKGVLRDVGCAAIDDFVYYIRYRR